MRHFRQSFYSALASSMEYRESEPLDPAVLDGLVTRLRAGDSTVIGKIISGHLRMVMAIVGDRVKARRKVDDAIGAALLALTKAVHDAQYSLYDNNITFYITKSVQLAIKDEMANDHVVRVPNRTIRHKLALGAKFEELVPGDGMQLHEDSSDAELNNGFDDTANVKNIHGINHALPFHIPIAKPVCESAEFREAITKAAITPLEQAIIKLRSEGYGYEEIGKKVGYHPSRIGQIMPVIEERFDKLWQSST